MRALHLTILLNALASPAFGQDVSLQRCRAIADVMARVTCYDNLVDANAKQRPSVTPVAAIPPAVVTPKTGEATFGLPESRRPESVESVQSSVAANFGGWGPNSRIRLDNGQVWQVVDGTSISLAEKARKVSVKRGALGSFYLDIEGLNTSPRVRRVD